MPVASLVSTYRERAKECFRLAATARDAWTRQALETLGREMLESAAELQQLTGDLPEAPPPSGCGDGPPRG